MNTIPPTILELISSYISQEIDENEFSVLKVWIHTSSENKKAFTDYLLFYKKTRQIVFTSKTDENIAWDNIVSQLETPFLDATIIEKSDFRVRFLKQRISFLKYAAVILLLISVGYFFFMNHSTFKSTIEVPVNEQFVTLQLANGDVQTIKEDGTSQILNSNGAVVGTQKGSQLAYNNLSAKDTLVYNIIKVPYGKRFELQLSDGTQVQLNSGTSLQYPVQFISGQRREVFLNGEAYFDVATDVKHPFIVNTNDMDIKVLGTKFNVTAYKQDQKSYTVLVQGSVLASDKTEEQHEVILKPGNGAFFENNQIKTEVVDVKKYVAWVAGELMFIDDSFKVIANKLERKYNISIVNKYEELNDIMITATFKEENIEQVLKTFQTYKAFNYTINNKIITITKPKSMI